LCSVGVKRGRWRRSRGSSGCTAGGNGPFGDLIGSDGRQDQLTRRRYNSRHSDRRHAPISTPNTVCPRLHCGGPHRRIAKLTSPRSTTRASLAEPLGGSAPTTNLHPREVPIRGFCLPHSEGMWRGRARLTDLALGCQRTGGSSGESRTSPKAYRHSIVTDFRIPCTGLGRQALGRNRTSIGRSVFALTRPGQDLVVRSRARPTSEVGLQAQA
jgi:hypothetical protein